MEKNNVEIAKTVSSGDWGAVYQGVGDKEAETHFTFVANEGYHVSTYLNNKLLHNLEDGNMKIKIAQDDVR